MKFSAENLLIYDLKIAQLKTLLVKEENMYTVY